MGIDNRDDREGREEDRHGALEEEPGEPAGRRVQGSSDEREGDFGKEPRPNPPRTSNGRQKPHVADWVVAGATVVYAIAAGWQLHTLQRQLTLMQESLDQVGESNRINRQLVAANLSVAKTTEQAYKHSARARLEPESFSSAGKKSQRDGEILPVNVTVRNIGHSNAKISISGEIIFGKSGVTIPVCNNTPAHLEASGLINVDAGGSKEYQFAGSQLKPDEIRSAETGQLQVALVGKIRSTDEIGDTHCTMMCAYLEPANGALRARNHQATGQIWGKCHLNGEEYN
jgi:hypothetical protein